MIVQSLGCSLKIKLASIKIDKIKAKSQSCTSVIESVFIIAYQLFQMILYFQFFWYFVLSDDKFTYLRM